MNLDLMETLTTLQVAGIEETGEPVRVLMDAAIYLAEEEGISSEEYFLIRRGILWGFHAGRKAARRAR